MRSPISPCGLFVSVLLLCAGCTQSTEMGFRGVDPDFGGLQGGKSVRLKGRNLRLDIGYSVYFGPHVSPQVSILNDATLLAVTPRMRTPGKVDVTVRADNGPVFRIKNGFEYINQAAGNLFDTEP